MEDIGDILFYIIAAVIGLITTLGKKKKKPAATPLPAEVPGPDTFEEEPVFEYEPIDIEYRAGTGDYENVIEKDRVKTGSPIVFDPFMEGSYEGPMAERFENEGTAQLVEEEEEAKAKAKVDDEIIEKSGIEDFLSDFDLRKAVIFSEILDRKDY